MKIFSALQKLTTWIQPGNVGNTGGISNIPHGAFMMTPGSPATFSANGAVPYDNGYFYADLPGEWSGVSLFSYRFKMRFPKMSDYEACQAFEFELQQNAGSRIYNMAYQFDFKGSKLVRTFDYTTSVWFPTSISTDCIGQENTIEALFVRDTVEQTTTHVGIRINGTFYPVGFRRPSTPKVESDYVHCAIQLDSTNPPVPYVVEVDDVEVMML